MPACNDTGYSRKDILLFKYNGTPDATNAFLVSGDINPNVTQSEESHDLVGNGKMNNVTKTYDNNNKQVDFPVSMLVEGTGAAGTPPRMADFYKAAGMTETIDTTNNKVIYRLHYDCIEPSTAVVYKGGKQKTVYTDLVAGMTISGAIGTSIKISFPLAGFTDEIKTNETISVGDIPFHNPFTIDYLTAVTVGGASVNLESFEIANNADIGKYYFTQMRLAARSNINPTASIAAVKNFNDASAWTDFLNRTAKEIIIGASNADGEKYTIKMPNAIPLPVSDGDSNGVLMENRQYDLKDDANGVALEIIYE